MDFNAILTLLEVAEKAAGHPQLKAIRDEALKELDAIAKAATPVPAPPPKPAATPDMAKPAPTPVFPPNTGVHERPSTPQTPSGVKIGG